MEVRGEAGGASCSQTEKGREAARGRGLGEPYEKVGRAREQEMGFRI